MGVAVKIGSMTISTSAASAAVDGGIAMAADPHDPRTVCVGVTEIAAIVVDDTYPVTDVAVNTQRGISNSCRVVMSMARRIGTWGSGEEVGPVADDTVRVRSDGHNQWPIDWILQARGGGVTIAAFVLVDGHWVIGRMTTDAKCGVADVVESCCRVVNVEMCAWCSLVLMAVQAVDNRLVGIGNDLTDCGAGCCYWVDVTSGVMAGGAVDMQGEDFSKVGNSVAVGAGLRIRLAAIGGWVELDRVVDDAAGGAMVVTGEVCAVAGDAFAASSNGRRDQCAIAGGVVTSCATVSSMSLAGTDKG